MSKVIINKMVDDDPTEVSETIKREIDSPVTQRVEPDLIKASEEMWRDMFGDE